MAEEMTKAQELLQIASLAVSKLTMMAAHWQEAHSAVEKRHDVAEALSHLENAGQLFHELGELSLRAATLSGQILMPDRVAPPDDDSEAGAPE